MNDTFYEVKMIYQLRSDTKICTELDICHLNDIFYEFELFFQLLFSNGLLVITFIKEILYTNSIIDKPFVT